MMKKLLPVLVAACALTVSLAACDKLPGKQQVSFQNTDVTGLDYAKGLASVMQKLGPLADQVQVLFITLDPERDTQQLLANYVPAFDKRFIGLRGTPEQTAKTAKEFKVFYSKVPGTSPGSYTIDHTAGSYVFDRDGRLRLFIRHGQGPDPVVHDIRQLLS
jgi:protein SCO1/2